MKTINLIMSDDNNDAVADRNVGDWYDEFISSSKTTIGIATDTQFNAIRIGVVAKEIAPFSFDFNGKEVFVDEDAALSEWPEGMFDQTIKQMQVLISQEPKKIDYKSGPVKW